MISNLLSVTIHKIIFIILLSTLFLLLMNTKDVVIFAHNFDTDDNSSFLTLINRLKIENQLLNDSISNSNNNSNNHLNSFEHTKNIENILEEILISEDSFIVDSDQFYNNTIIALVVANLADEVLRKYGHAFGVPSNIMLSMNFSNVTSGLNYSNNTAKIALHSSHMTNQENTTSISMVDNSSYQNALKISDRMIEIYNSELKTLSSSNSVFINKAKSDLNSALYDLRKDIEAKESPSKIMEDVHGRIHPNLQIAFNLTLRR
jgi:hypothetical protein